MKTLRKPGSVFFALLFFSLSHSLFAEGQPIADEVIIGNFSEGELSGWEEESFKGNSEYTFVTNTLSAKKVLQASTQGQASGLFKKVDIDLNKTPYLHWSWRVKNLFTGNDERSKEGDDYPARIYVVVSGGIFFWKTKAINYVWSSNQAQGSEWDNAYTSNAKMIAVQAGEDNLGKWVHERRNIKQDLQRLFGDELTRIDAVAVMVDGDNTGQSARAYFGDIVFSAE